MFKLINECNLEMSLVHWLHTPVYSLYALKQNSIGNGLINLVDFFFPLVNKSVDVGNWMFFLVFKLWILFWVLCLFFQNNALLQYIFIFVNGNFKKIKS